MSTNVTRKDFAEKLKSLDWYYQYSDDYSVWAAGEKAFKEARQMREDVGCPFSMAMLRKWANKEAIPFFEERSPDCWYRKGEKPKGYVSPFPRAGLLIADEYDQMTAWFDDE